MNQPLADAIFWVSAFACVIAEIAILRSTFVARHVEKSNLVPASSRTSEIVWAIIPALVLAALFGSTWQKVQHKGGMPMEMHSHSMATP